MHIQLLQATVDTGTDWPDAMIAIAGIAMITGIIVVAIWQIFASWRARVSVAREAAYRQLAEQSSSAQQQAAQQLEQLTTGVADLRGRVAAIEKLLREVG